MENDVLTRNENGELAVRIVSATEQATVVNPNDVYTRDTNNNLAIRTVGGSGGGSIDTSKVVNADVLPTADSSNVGKFYLYKGETTASYTHGYIYENVRSATYTGTVSFDPATLSSAVVTCSGDDFATLVAEWGDGDITTITHGTLTYDQSGGLLVFVGKDVGENTVCTFQLYIEDYQDAGFTITGTLQDGDVVAFTCTIEEDTVSYTWTRIDVQPQGATINDNSTTSLTETWSASKLNTMIGNIETLLSQI